MAQAVGPLIDTVLQRVRDAQGAVHSRAVVLRLFEHAQRVLNTKVEDSLSEITLTTRARKTVYRISTEIPNAVKIKAVRENGRDLSGSSLSQLAHVSRTWFRDVGDQFELFAPIGRDLLALYPSQLSDSTVTVVAVARTADFANESASTEIYDDNIPHLIDLVELILLARGREFGPVQDATQRFSEDLKVGEVRRAAISR